MEENNTQQSMEIVPQHAEFPPSSMERKFYCPGSHAMEKLVTEDTASEAAKAGSRIHAYAKILIDNMSATEEEQRKALPEDADENEIRIAQQIQDFVAAEMEVYGWTGDKLLTEQRIEYKNMTMILFWGTSDLVVIDDDDDMIYIYDWKTGFRKVEAAQNNFQGASYALAAMQTFKKSRCRVVFYNPVINQITDNVFDDWNEIYEVINGIIVKCNDPNAPRIPGTKQCLYCKAAAKGICPEFMAWKNAQVSVCVSQGKILPINEWPDDYLGTTLKQCRMIESLKKAVEDELKNRLNANGECAGWKIKETSGGREPKDVNGIYHAVNDKFTPEEFMSFCSLSIAKLQKAYAVKAKEDGSVQTQKDGTALFDNLVAAYVSEKPPRQNLVPPEE